MIEWYPFFRAMFGAAVFLFLVMMGTAIILAAVDYRKRKQQRLAQEQNIAELKMRFRQMSDFQLKVWCNTHKKDFFVRHLNCEAKQIINDELKRRKMYAYSIS